MKNRAIFCFVLIFSFSSLILSQNLEIHHINVGQGDSTLIIGPDGTTILIDAGNNGKGDNVVVPYLKKKNIDELDYILGSHMHADHIGGLDEVIYSNVNVVKVFDNGSNSTSNTYNDYVNATNTVGGRIAITPGTKIDLGNGAYALCVYCNGKSESGNYPVTNENDKSVALIIVYGDFQYFIGGDLGGGGGSQKNVEGFIKDEVGDVDVLRVSHHGSTSSTSDNFVNTVKPEAAIISVGQNNYGHPTQEVLNRLYLENIDVLQTGAGVNPSGKILGHIVIIVSEGKKYTINKIKRFKDEKIKKSNQAPKASFNYTNNDKTVSFDSSSSSDDKKITYYYWNFGDGSVFKGRKAINPKHTYQNYGTYKVGLNVLDKYGTSDTTFQNVTIPQNGGLKVTASANPSNPDRYSNVKISCNVTDNIGNPVSGADITTIAHYKTTDTTKTGTTGTNGTASINYYIAGATAGYRVWVDVTARYQGKTATTTTSFTPKGAAETIAVTAYASPSNPKRYTHVKINCTVKSSNGSPISGASIRTVAHYKTTNTTKTGTTGSNGTVSIDYYISGATAGYRVYVDVTATYQGKTATTTTSFLPHN